MRLGWVALLVFLSTSSVASIRVTGAVDRLVRGEGGRVDGLILQDHTFVGFRPDSLADPSELRYGDHLVVEGKSANTRPNRVLKRVRIIKEGRVVLDDTSARKSAREPDMTANAQARFLAMNEQGKIFAISVGTADAVDRIFLESGAIVRPPPDAILRAKAIQLGETILVRGFGNVYGNTRFIHALDVQRPDETSLLATRAGEREPWRVKSGTVRQALVTPEGLVDGILLGDDSILRFPPIAPKSLAAVGPGTRIQAAGPSFSNQLAAGRAFLPERQQVLDFKSARVRTQEAGTAARDLEPIVKMGVVQAALLNSNGMLNSVVLRDGTTVRLPGSVARKLQRRLKRGDVVEVKGRGGVYPRGTGVEASSFEIKNSRGVASPFSKDEISQR